MNHKKYFLFYVFFVLFFTNSIIPTQATSFSEEDKISIEYLKNFKNPSHNFFKEKYTKIKNTEIISFFDLKDYDPSIKQPNHNRAGLLRLTYSEGQSIHVKVILKPRTPHQANLEKECYHFSEDYKLNVVPPTWIIDDIPESLKKSSDKEAWIGSMVLDQSIDTWCREDIENSDPNIVKKMLALSRAFAFLSGNWDIKFQNFILTKEQGYSIDNEIRVPLCHFPLSHTKQKEYPFSLLLKRNECSIASIAQDIEAIRGGKAQYVSSATQDSNEWKTFLGAMKLDPYATQTEEGRQKRMQTYFRGWGGENQTIGFFLGEAGLWFQHYQSLKYYHQWNTYDLMPFLTLDVIESLKSITREGLTNYFSDTNMFFDLMLERRDWIIDIWRKENPHPLT